MAPGQVILIGDSIRLGYQEAARAALAGRAEVWGPEQNGGDSANVRQHLEAWALSRPAAVVHLNCGLHDLKRPFGADANQVPLAAYEENLRDIFGRLAQACPGRVAWATTTPVDEDRHHRTKGFDRLAADLAAYNVVALRLAAEYRVPVDDLHGAVTAAGPGGLLAADGVHFLAPGYELLGRTVAAFLQRWLP
ncbi:MAG: GDSL-type esterase/lipase family protein [Gemmatimonadota bacterium]